MITILSDHNIEGQTELLWGTLGTEGWLSLIPIKWLTFQQVGLPISSPDREVWQFAQANQMILLTANRNMEDENGAVLAQQLIAGTMSFLFVYLFISASGYFFPHWQLNN